VNGAREDANNFLLDGAYNGDPKLNGVGVTRPWDASASSNGGFHLRHRFRQKRGRTNQCSHALRRQPLSRHRA